MPGYSASLECLTYKSNFGGNLRRVDETAAHVDGLIGYALR